MIPKPAHRSLLACIVALVVTRQELAGQDDKCRSQSNRLLQSLTTASVAADARGAVRETFETALQALQACPADEMTWYVFLRSAELGGGRFGLIVDRENLQDWQSATAAATHRLPRSQRIAVIRARAVRTEEAGRFALSLDPTYPPAQVTLASILFERGDIKSAHEILEHTRDLRRVPMGYLLLARCLVAAGRFDAALQAVAKEGGGGVDSFEPGGQDVIAARDIAEVRGLAYLGSKRFRPAATELLTAASTGSTAAMEALQQPPIGLRRAMLALHGSPQLSAAEARLLRLLLDR